MATPFQEVLPVNNPETTVFRDPVDPVDNSVANAIRGVTGLVQLGATEYKKKQESDTLKSVAKEIQKNKNAVLQGKMKIGDADIKDNSIISSAIVSNPHLTTELRNIGITIKGTDVSAELDESARYDEELHQQRTANLDSGLINDAAAVGFAPTKADGTYDYDKMKEFAINERARLAKIEALNALNKTTTAGERENTRRTKYEPIYTDFQNSKIDTLLSAINNAGADLTPQQEQDLLIQVTGGIESSVEQLRAEVLQAGNTTAEADFFESKFRAKAKVFTDLFTGEKSSAKRARDTVEYLRAKTTIDVANSVPVIWGAGVSGLPIQKLELDDITAQTETDLQETLPEISTKGVATNTPLPIEAHLDGAVGVLSYGRDYNSLAQDTKIMATDLAMETLHTGLPTFNDATPNERIGITNSLGVIVDNLVSGAVSNQTVTGYSNYLNRATVRNAIPTLARDSQTVEKVGTIADKIIDYSQEYFRVNEVTTKDIADPIVQSLLKNVEFFYPYSFNVAPTDLSLDEFKSQLFKDSNDEEIKE